MILFLRIYCSQMALVVALLFFSHPLPNDQRQIAGVFFVLFFFNRVSWLKKGRVKMGAMQ